MKTRSQTIAKAVLVSSALLTSCAALADPPHWANAYGYRDHHDHDDRDFDYARVVDVDPIIRHVRVSSPQRECWNEDRPVSSGPSGTEVRATLVGGLIGAVVGHQIGYRHHDAAAVVGGSMIGAAIGNSIGANEAAKRGEYRQVGYESVQRCEVTNRDEWVDEADGYRVTYVYNGREYTTRMPYDPGQRIRVGVDVRPDFDRR
jgi:uncharacterized protein YcfJ